MEKSLARHKYENLQRPGWDLRRYKYTDSEFNGANFQGAKLQKAKFIRTTILKVDFTNTKLNGADFSNATILKADFTGAELRGANFSGAKLGKVNFGNAQLEGANFTDAEVLPDHKLDFSNANIKGADFTDAKFKYVNFYGVNAGVNNFWLFIVIISSIVFCLLSAFTTAIILTFSRYYFCGKKKSTTSILLVSVLFITVVRYYLNSLNISVLTIQIPNKISPLPVTLSYIHLFLAIFLIILAEYSVLLIVLLQELKFNIKSLIFITLGLIFYILIALHPESGNIIYNLSAHLLPPELGGGILGAFIGAGIGRYFADEVMKKNETFDWLWKIYVTFTSYKGTIFNQTDLSDAVFEQASLRGANFKNAIITRTRWYEAKDLDFARFGNSYLKFSEVRQLLVNNTFVGQKNKDKIFVDRDLQGLNLENAILSNINFSGTNLSQANLRGANLHSAILKETKLDGADLTDATLTEACIEGLNYNESTILTGVKCECVYIKMYPDSRHGWERLPRTKNFKQGDFEKFFKKDKKIIQLLVRNDDNKEALASAFHSLMQDNHFIFKGFDVIGDDALVKIQIPDNEDKDIVENSFYQLYKTKNKEVTNSNQPNSEFTKVSSEGAVHFIISSGIVYMTQNDLSNNVSVGGDLNSSGTFNLGEIIGDVTNTINQLPVSPEPEKPGIKELLTELQTAIEAEENLTPKNKEKALKQVKALAEASQKPNNEEKQDLADTAITMLKGLISGLPTAATLYEACNELLPLISKSLGLG